MFSFDLASDDYFNYGDSDLLGDNALDFTNSATDSGSFWDDPLGGVGDFLSDGNVLQNLISGGLAIYQQSAAQDQYDQKLQFAQQEKEEQRKLEKFKIFAELAKLEHLQSGGSGGGGASSQINKNIALINTLNAGASSQIQALNNFAANYTNAFR